MMKELLKSNFRPDWPDRPPPQVSYYFLSYDRYEQYWHTRSSSGLLSYTVQALFRKRKKSTFIIFHIPCSENHFEARIQTTSSSWLSSICAIDVGRVDHSTRFFSSALLRKGIYPLCTSRGHLSSNFPSWMT